ncbi:MAG: hypothetical protein DRI24_18225 [Deltaproteobacteria bacterium]|nr:MAG: hypothetical protein DRI24_18225 [Deltaproteobacteria bacterium]
MKMLAAEYIGAKVAHSHTNPIGQLILSEAPPGVAEFALALRKIDADFTYHLTNDYTSDGVPMFTEAESYLTWYAMEVGSQHPDQTIELFGFAEADDFENAFTDSETLEDYLNVAHGAAKAELQRQAVEAADLSQEMPIEEGHDVPSEKSEARPIWSLAVIDQARAQEACSMVAEDAIESLAEALHVEIDLDGADYNRIMAVKQALFNLLSDYATLEVN